MWFERTARQWTVGHAAAVATLAVFAGTAAVFAGTGLASTPARRLPSFAKVEETVTRHFESLPGYRPGAIITRSEAEAALKELERLGWSVADRRGLLEQVLPDNDFLVQQLRSPEGAKFMSRIATYPQGYDRLDRLRRLQNGRQTIRDLIRGPGGYKLIEYMTSSSGGAELGKMLSRSPSGAGFNQSTGRIYTVGDLLGQLKKAYGAEKGTR